jgi:hypothetical protein
MTGVEIGSAYVTILPDGSKIGPEVKRQFGVVGGEADRAGRTGGKRFGGAFNGAAKAVLGVAGGALALSKLSGFLGDSLGEAREAAQVGRRTDNVIKSMGNSSKVSAKHVGDLAGKISAKIGVDDEAIQSGENLLLTFGNVRNEVGKGNKIFDRSTRLMADMSAAMGTDMKGSAVQLGKALNDPVKGMTALTRVGVSFNETQKQTVKSLIEGGDKNAVFAMQLVKNGEEWSDALKANKGDIAATVESLTKNLSDAQKKRYDFLAEGGHQLEAQKIILKEVERQFKGAGEAAADPAKKLQVAYGNLKEQIGTELLPYADRFATFLTNKGVPAISNFLDQMKTGKGRGGQAAELFRTIRDDAKAAARFAGDMIDRFNDLPDWAKKGLIVGAGTAAVAKKTGLIGGGGLRGATPLTPMYVRVVGAGPGVNAGVPTKGPKSKGGAASTALAIAGVEFIATNVGKTLPASKLLGDAVKLGPQLEGMFGKSMDKSAKGFLSAAEKYDAAIVKTVKGDGAAAFGAFQRTADRAGLSLTDLGSLLPKTRDKINELGGRANYAKQNTENWRTTLLGTNKQLDRLDGKRPNVVIRHNVPEVLRFVNTLGRQIDTKIERTARLNIALTTNGVGHFGLQARANGGSVRAGVPYIVGERRPELFVPETNGRIEPRVGGGVQFYGTQIVAHDYQDFMQQAQNRANHRAWGAS